jgi:hypothetical protein
MEDRQFTEVDLRRMLQHASALSPDAVEGRWAVGARHSGQVWEIVVEPDSEMRLLVVITAYQVG